MLIAPIDGTVLPDVAALSTGGETVLVAFDLVDGAFTSTQTLSVGAAPSSLAAGDLDGDGRVDLVTSNEGGDSISVLYQIDTHTFEPEVMISGPTAPTTVAIGDIDGDGTLDLGVGSPNDDDGLVLVLPDESLVLDSPGSVWTVLLVDLNADTQTDVLSLDASAGTFTAHLRQ